MARAVVIAGLGVATAGVLAFAVTFVRTPREAIASTVTSSVVSAATFDAFASTGAAGPTGVRIDAAGRFVARAEVVGAQHSTLALDTTRGDQLINIAGARLYGLPRGASDLSIVEGARVLVQGTCPPSTTQLDASCTTETVLVRYDVRSTAPIKSAVPPLGLEQSAA
ncbi:MAG: hypothetical protein DWI48_02180 [Chloroflexi bacterium]|nr:MAG: hypothetical protein DWI48_02180 [Chloroflexota bacterium]